MKNKLHTKNRSAFITYLPLISDIKVIFDIGANVGNYTAVFAEFFPEAKIIAFEPIPDNFRQLQKSTRNNHNIQSFDFGLWSENAKIKMGIPSHREDNAGLYTCLDIDKKNTQECGFRCLDEVAESISLSPDLIKIDVEGAEDKVIEGGIKSFGNCRYVIIEGASLIKPKDVQRLPAANMLRDLGFKEVISLATKQDYFWHKT